MHGFGIVFAHSIGVCWRAHGVFFRKGRFLKKNRLNPILLLGGKYAEHYGVWLIFHHQYCSYCCFYSDLRKNLVQKGRIVTRSTLFWHLPKGAHDVE